MLLYCFSLILVQPKTLWELSYNWRFFPSRGGFLEKMITKLPTNG